MATSQFLMEAGWVRSLLRTDHGCDGYKALRFRYTNPEIGKFASISRVEIEIEFLDSCSQ